MRYRINLVKGIREEERRRDAERARVVVLAVVCFAVLAGSMVYAATRVLAMRRTLAHERAELERIEAEYRRYKTTTMIVDRADIELLDKLYNGKVFWTKKLEAMARHLPEEYWITSFSHRRESYKVNGYGYISEAQRQLVTIDGYLNQLRKDESFSDVFRDVYFNSTVRRDEGSRKRVTFDYTAERSK